MQRRKFFEMGGLSIGAISPLGLSLSEVLASEAAGGGKKQINVIFMFLQGGASHIDMYDMKPDMPPEIRGKYRPAPTNIPGLHLSEKLPKLGALRRQILPDSIDVLVQQQARSGRCGAHVREPD